MSTALESGKAAGSLERDLYQQKKDSDGDEVVRDGSNERSESVNSD